MTAPKTDPRSRLFPPGIAAVSVLVGVGLQYLWPLRLISFISLPMAKKPYEIQNRWLLLHSMLTPPLETGTIK